MMFLSFLKNSNSDDIDESRKIRTVKNNDVAEDSFNSFSPNEQFIEFYTNVFRFET